MNAIGKTFNGYLSWHMFFKMECDFAKEDRRLVRKLDLKF